MTASPKSEIAAEVVVIGSGPGGSVTATLCAEAGKSVLMIEEGRHLALESAPHFSQQEILQKYRSAGVTVALGNSSIAYVEGRCVGGGSEINRGLYFRTPDYLLQEWRTAFAVEDLTETSLRPHFEACESTARVEYLPGDAPPMSRRLFQGAQRLGWAAVEAPRLYAYGASGAPGRKQSMSETFVPRFLAAGGRLITDTFAVRLIRSDWKWRVLASQANGSGAKRQIEILADHVFVACGAVQTPALLRRSGITRNVGNSLRFHPMVKVVAAFDDEVNDPESFDPVHQIKQFEPSFSMGCSISKPHMLALAMVDHPDHINEIKHNWRRMAIYYVQNSSGRARVRHIPSLRDPIVTVAQTPANLAQLAEGLRRLIEALFAGGARVIYPSLPGYPVLRSRAELDCLPQTLLPSVCNATSVHVFSSCPMGEHARCATDSFGRVKGADGLYIADASLLCGPTVVNPQGTVMAIAHRNALHAIDRQFRARAPS